MTTALLESATADSCSECDQLTGRMRDICMGISGLPRDTENKYRALPQFGSLPPLPANVPSSKPDHKARGGSVKISGNAEKQAEKPWDVTQPARGLGDVVAKITHATGLDKVAEAGARLLGMTKDCGCKGRQNRLNQLVPFTATQPAAEDGPAVHSASNNLPGGTPK